MQQRGCVNVPEAIPLVRVLRTVPEAPYRADAARRLTRGFDPRRLVHLREPEVATALRAALDDPEPQVRLPIAACVLWHWSTGARLGEMAPFDLATLPVLIGDADPTVAGAGRTALGTHCAQAAILRGLDGPEPIARLTSARVLRIAVHVAPIPTDRAFRTLSGAVEDADPEVRQAAVEALGRSVDPRVLAPLSLAAELDECEAIRRAAFAAILDLGQG